MVGFAECDDSKMKYYYGYSGKPPDLEPDKNMDLKLYEMMAEAQWSLKQEATAQREIVIDNDMNADRHGLEITKDGPELSGAVHHIRAKLSVSSSPGTKEHHAARIALQMSLESESDFEEKHFLDKKV